MGRCNIKLAKAAIDNVFAKAINSRIEYAMKAPKQSHRIRLTKTKDYRNVVKHGLGNVQMQIGAENVELDDESDPPALLILGDGDAISQAKAALHTPDGQDSTCPICYDEADEVVSVPICGHVACKGRFVQYCILPRDGKFPLLCFQSDCSNRLPMPLLRETLSVEEVEDMLEQALTNHFECNPAAYMKCTGPDCDSYYAADEVILDPSP